MLKLEKARDIQKDAKKVCKERFGLGAEFQEPMDAIFMNYQVQNVFGVIGTAFQCPISLELLKHSEIKGFLKGFFDQNISVLIRRSDSTRTLKLYLYDQMNVTEQGIPEPIAALILEQILATSQWVGFLNEKGDHITDLLSPPPGPHFYANLLMGNRIGFQAPLLTTPKSVVDRLGRGSFRSHAGTQVLATKWDYLPEDNGFPANRQFYLVENGEQIFYSAKVNDPRVKKAVCKHSQNHTIITYITTCGLEIERIIFLLPHQEGLPLATEVQRICIKNTTKAARDIKMIYTGMFGTSAAHALSIDVVYTTLIMQGSMLKTEDGQIGALSFHNNPDYLQEDIRFHSMLIHEDQGVTYPEEFTMHYSTFVGSGSLEKPQGIHQLNNQLSRKGPGFFALGKELHLLPEKTCRIDNFTGLVSGKCQEAFDERVFEREVNNLLEVYSKPDKVVESLEHQKNFMEAYAANMQIQTENEQLNAYFNNNLPFQVLYQTFVSRSFCWTQKGYREIGFREIQDIFASMYYFIGMNKQDLVKSLMKEWFENVYEAGYANHNFYWEGKEPGRCSDDALWLLQAVDRYLQLTGDYTILEESFETAERTGRKRSLYQTLLAIIKYSNQISIGDHGLPLLDHSDWNDCLQLDLNPVSPQQKVGQFQASDKALETDQSESVMNAFLLKLGIDAVRKMAIQKGDYTQVELLSKASQTLYDNIQKHCWKDDFFARVLFNREIEGDIHYLGAGNDGLSMDKDIAGTYFINSFTWAVLSEATTEEQIERMLNTTEKYLKTPHGLLLCTQANYRKVCKEASSAHYFVGDRENGAVFKHANMMAASALFKAAKKVASKELAKRLTDLAYWTIDQVLPYKALDNPYVKAGNPRLCTQYNNSQTGEGIGPVLSGTSTWLILTMMEALGLEYVKDGLKLTPLMRYEETRLDMKLKEGHTVYSIHIEKPKGFYRVKDSVVETYFDGSLWEAKTLPRQQDGLEHEIKMIFKKGQ